MNINKYVELLLEGKLEEAEEVRQSTIPERLIKFIWLDDVSSDGRIDKRAVERNEEKFSSLERDEIWFSHRRFVCSSL